MYVGVWEARKTEQIDFFLLSQFVSITDLVINLTENNKGASHFLLDC